jgi:predicted XRE-type DNA-binding protein
MSRKPRATPSSGNVFKEVGLPNPEELLVKAELVRQIGEIIDERGLTRTAAAKVLRTTQPKVSAMLRGKLDGFSMERLIRFRNALNRDVEIVVRETPRGRKRGNVSIVPA